MASVTSPAHVVHQQTASTTLTPGDSSWLTLQSRLLGHQHTSAQTLWEVRAPAELQSGEVHAVTCAVSACCMLGLLRLLDTIVMQQDEGVLAQQL